MKFKRQFTKKGNDAYAGLEFKTTSSEIKNPDGTIVFSAPNIEVPGNYSQVAADIIAQKYFRKAGVPTFVKKVKEKNIPNWLWRSEPDTEKLNKNWDEKDYDGGRNFGHLAFEVDDIYAVCKRLLQNKIIINRPPRDGRMAFVQSPDQISIELLQKGKSLPIISPWKDMPNQGTW